MQFLCCISRVRPKELLTVYLMLVSLTCLVTYIVKSSQPNHVYNVIIPVCSNQSQKTVLDELDNGNVNDVDLTACSCGNNASQFNCSIICMHSPQSSSTESSQDLQKRETQLVYMKDRNTTASLKVTYKSPIVLVMIFSRPSSFRLRQSSRNTWLNSSISEKAVVHKFVIGLSGLDHELFNDIQKESEKYRDLLLFDKHKEAYGPQCTDKLLRTLQWASKHSTAQYLMKTDDDCYVRLDYIIHILETRSKISHKPFLCGTIVQHEIPNSEGKWAEHGWHHTKEYLPFPLGSGYILPQALVKAIVTSNDLVPLRKLNNEDVTVGLWLAQYNIDYVYIQRYDHDLISEEEACLVCPHAAENITIFHCSQSHELMYEAHNCLKKIRIGCFCNVLVK